MASYLDFSSSYPYQRGPSNPTDGGRGNGRGSYSGSWTSFRFAGDNRSAMGVEDFDRAAKGLRRAKGRRPKSRLRLDQTQA